MTNNWIDNMAHNSSKSYIFNNYMVIEYHTEFYITSYPDSNFSITNPFDNSSLLYDFINLARLYPEICNNYNHLYKKYFNAINLNPLNADIVTNTKNDIINYISDTILPYVRANGFFGRALKTISYACLTPDGSSYRVFCGMFEYTYEDYMKPYFPNSDSCVPFFNETPDSFWKGFHEPMTDILTTLEYFYNLYIKNIDFGAHDFVAKNHAYLENLFSGDFQGTERPYIYPASIFPRWKNKSKHPLELHYGCYSHIDSIELMLFLEIIKKINGVKGVLLHCENCNTLFLQDTGKDSKFCTDSCRSNYSLKNKRKTEKPIKILELILVEKLSNDEIRKYIGDKSYATDNRIANFSKVHTLYTSNPQITATDIKTNYFMSKKYMDLTTIEMLLDKIKELYKEGRL